MAVPAISPEALAASREEALAKTPRLPIKTDFVSGSINLKGVMIDDLTSLGVKEPYRMFTSRAEFRLSLRADNADTRLTERGYRAGIVSEERYKLFTDRAASLNAAKVSLAGLKLPSAVWAREIGPIVSADGPPKTGLEVLAYPNVSLQQIAGVAERVLPE